MTRAMLAARSHPLRYFRHPFLQTGVNLQTKRALERYLVAHGYQVASVILDNSDYVFAKVSRDALNRKDQAFAERVKLLLDSPLVQDQRHAAKGGTRRTRVADH